MLSIIFSRAAGCKCGLIRVFSGSGRNSFKASSHPLFIDSSGAPKGWNGRETIFRFSWIGGGGMVMKEYRKPLAKASDLKV